MKKLTFLLLTCLSLLAMAVEPFPKWTGEWLTPWSRYGVKLKAKMEGDILVLTDFGFDSNIHLGGLDIDADGTQAIEFEYRAFNTPEKTTGQIFFADAIEHKWHGPFYLPSLIADGKWHVVRMTRQNMNKPQEFTGTIPTLRIDLMDQAGASDTRIEIRRIEVIQKPVRTSELDWVGEELALWSAVRCKPRMQDEVLRIGSIGKDSNIHKGGISFDTKDYIGVDVEYRAVNTPDVTSGQLFFMSDKSGGAPVGYFHINNLKNDGQWHKLELRSKNLQKSDTWAKAGTVTQLRLDLIDQEGSPDAYIDVRRINVVPVQEEATPENFSGHTLIRLPPMVSKPKIDGNFNVHEWRDATAQYGGVSSLNGMLAWRWVDFYFGYDDENIYFAQRSILPPAPMKLEENDTIELDIGFGENVTKVIFNHEGKGRIPEGTQLKSWFDENNFWISEMAIPVKALGVPSIPYNKECKLQMVRHYRNLDEDLFWHSPTKKIPFATFIPEKEVPVCSFSSLYPQLGHVYSSHSASWNVRNNTTREQNVTFDISITSHEAPMVVSKTETIMPEKYAGANLRGQWAWDVVRHARAEIRDAKTGKPYFQRYFRWDQGQQFRWKDPNPPFKFQIAVYPTAQRVRTFLSCEKRAKLDAVKPPKVTIVNSSGRVMAELKSVRKAAGFEHDGPLPKLPNGKYTICAELTNIKGEIEKFSDSFTVANFPWERLNLGMDRIVVPPFKPLAVKDAEIHALQTGFKEGANGFWDAVYALDENILAKPVEFTLNGETPKLVASRTIETSPDLVVRESDLQFKDMMLTVRREYEQDGFCKVFLSFKPAKAVKITQMDLNFPVKKEIAQYHFASGINIRMNIKGAIPKEKGVVLDSTKKNGPGSFLGDFRPYIWLGEYAKGFSYTCETPRYWGRQKGKPMQEITVDDDAVRLRLHLASGPIVYDKPCTIVMAFQPTPVKPRPAGSQAYTKPAPPGPPLPKGSKGMVLSSHNAVFFRYDDGMYVPPNGDWSFIDFILDKKWKTIDEVNAFNAEYYKRNNLSNRQFSLLNGPNMWWARCPMDRYMRETAIFTKDSSYNVIYANARVLCHTWPEFEVYADEWEMNAWRPERRLDEYKIQPVPSYIDFSLYQIRDLIRHGMDGTYYDNIFEGFVHDPVTSVAFENEDGTINPCFGIFDLRNLVKRTAIMMYKEGKSFEGYPPIMLHMTDCPLVPVLSFAGQILDWEMNFGRNTYQERFPIEYGICATTGVQAGVSPLVIMDTNGCDGDRPRVVKSALAMTFIYNCTNHLLTTEGGKTLENSDFYGVAMTKLYEFGYGLRDTVTWPALQPDNPVKITPANVKATVSKRADGAVLLMVGNLGDAVEATFDLGSLAKGVSTDLMTGKKIGTGSKFVFPVEKEGFALVEVKP